jgi:hypothetical protein
MPNSSGDGGLVCRAIRIARVIPIIARQQISGCRFCVLLKVWGTGIIRTARCIEFFKMEDGRQQGITARVSALF